MINCVGLCLFLLLTAGLAVPAAGGTEFERDILPASGGEVAVTFIGHGSLMLEYQGKVIHIDPYSRVADYALLPKADIILLTHHHQDHLDETALNLVRTPATKVVLTEKCAEKVAGRLVMGNGDQQTVQDISIAAIPAYNIVHRRAGGELFHPRGEGNGYVLSLGGIRIYLAGDTENTPEMKALRDIDYAFLPMNLPYTMTPEMVADAALAFRPGVLYPYHYGETDPNELAALLKDAKDIEVRIRSMR
ncbi:MAG: MBL fold metallo-hydrolase [Desulfobulbaceae bacterium]|nr:MBL fold metallo-hydrolase [Desulfobulbaceae bacterium]